MAIEEITKDKLLNDALKGLCKYLEGDAPDLALAADYLIDLDNWANGPQAQSIPPDPPPPPPGGGNE